ncbi:MAG: hypothetical protein JWN74_3154 [Acidobacteriaceae bacterium]|nr:hypothetical protein [Acidobacteriaceae bacterium]
MPKYGIFNEGEESPYKTIEDDSIFQHGQFVEIFRGQEADAKVVAAIRLEKGQRVQEVLSSG